MCSNDYKLLLEETESIVEVLFISVFYRCFFFFLKTFLKAFMPFPAYYA
jgi:hypothetical protein